MEDTNVVQLKVLSSPGVIEEIKSVWAKDSDTRILSSGPEQDPMLLKFGLESVMMIIGIVKVAFAVGEFATKIYNLLKQKNDRRVVVQSPIGRYEFVYREDLTEEEIRSVLRRLASAV